MRLRKKPWVAEALAGYGDIVLKADDYKGQWRELLGNNLPLHVEVGTGKGQFIAGMAERYKGELNFIGLEAQQDVLIYAAKKVREQQLNNVRLLVFNINDILDLFAPGEVERLYINFCDPWPKNRHARRRLTHSGFLAKYRTVLVPGGQVYFKTDNEKLFEFSLNQFADSGAKLANITFDLHNSGYQGNIMTEYETRFSSRGMRIYRCEITLG
ncbi:MAG TPA: tRNA (guanosine(46)-N7)-methyltransferase TrmB [Methylomusa anaerophila]|uniref:tRNA (guanine-N(7)-)-methyltransferase n=1 Tax=Methylomusa anaerophila TaxID=1930071 RepID=A0A348AHZ8_9FIRM|nr:tRNA (guanosine(46)-N7)-methyltransferase TrmB [Methylomusa anaerophila]BBB90696.1 tRNA (guanine-N(7)-)-methyltransferase [Methylomusa anaerophila]HML88701.1 tRNA (guanosine(46)-N7)-methyltransferase TrmB [Methylomusa anaerophila]